MWVVVGLGNPGERYAETRHNVGFMVVETVARRWAIPWAPPRRGTRLARGRVQGRAVVLVEPWEFMNCSGTSLARLSREIEMRSEALLVIHDDLDLVLGRVAVKHGGGAGGHRGLESVIDWAGPEFARIRIGIGRPPGDRDPAEYVLEPFAPEEWEIVRAAIERAADAVEAVVTEGVERARNKFNDRRLASLRQPAGS